MSAAPAPELALPPPSKAAVRVLAVHPAGAAPPFAGGAPDSLQVFAAPAPALEGGGLEEVLVWFRPDVFVSTGPALPEPLNAMPLTRRRFWLHVEDPAAVTEHGLLECYVRGALAPRPAALPLVSVVSTSFRSGHKIARPLVSLLRQTYCDWEWILVDDSPPGDANWELLGLVASLDHRVRIFRGGAAGGERERLPPAGADGVIGSVKFNASMLARGALLLELDHDDILAERALELLVQAANRWPDAGMFYSDFAEIYESPKSAGPLAFGPDGPLFAPSERALLGDEANFKYGDAWGFGFGAYLAVLYAGRWRYKAIAPPLNFRTLRHIVAMPNHFRAWRTAVYRSLGGNNPMFPVADDYELCVRSFCAARCVRIADLCYLQFRNLGGDNFTFHRNAHIQRLTGLASAYHHAAVGRRLRALGLPDPASAEDGARRDPGAWPPQAWCAPEDFPPPAELTLSPNPPKTVTVVAAVEDAEPRDLRRLVLALKAQTYDRWQLLILANGCDGLEAAMETLAPLCDARVAWWNIERPDYGPKALVHLFNYALLMACRDDFAAYVSFGRPETGGWGAPVRAPCRPPHVDAWAPDTLARLTAGCEERDFFTDPASGAFAHRKGERVLHWRSGEGPAEFAARSFPGRG